MRILELFGGIGACSKALERLGIDYEITDYVEIDKYAVASFNAMHGTNFEPQDITKWDKNIEVDLIMHGSPCQDFSIAGKQAGGDEGTGTRSSLMWQTLRIVEKIKPKYVIWENVKNLLSEKHRHNFDAYLEEMERIGYESKYKVLNAKDYGIPQNRERVFTVSFRKDLDDEFWLYQFPEKKKLELRLKDLLEDEIDKSYYLPNDQVLNMELNSDLLKEAAIHRVDIPQMVKVRKHPVNVEKLKAILKSHKNYNTKDIATIFDLPITTVEHWFRSDKCFSIPAPEMWFRIKALLKIKTDEFDKSVIEFEEKEGAYEKTNRCYLETGIAPTLTNTSADEKIIVKGKLNIKGQDQIKRVYGSEGVSPTLSTMQGGNRQPKIIEEPFIVASRGRGKNNEQRLEARKDGVTNTLTSVQKDNFVATKHRIRKLTPKECWRLMGFDDEDFKKAAQVNSNTQLYKQAGNSIVVNVLEAILGRLL